MRQPKGKLADQIVALHAVVGESAQTATHWKSRAERAEAALESANGRADLYAQDARKRVDALTKENEWLRERLEKSQEVADRLSSTVEHLAHKDTY